MLNRFVLGLGCPTAREGYYRYQGSTRCAMNKDAAYAPHAEW